MAVENPTCDSCVVTLEIPAGNEAFLRRVIVAAREGLGEDLDDHADRLRRPVTELLREEIALLSLQEGLDQGEVVPGPVLREVVARVAAAVDRDNEYERVVAEHEAIAALREQLGAQPLKQ
ncbi:MAG: hypothetical protein R2725_16210 [Solirubrobacterales bacterium]